MAERWHRLLGVAQTAFFAAVRTPDGVLLAGPTNEMLRPRRPGGGATFPGVPGWTVPFAASAGLGGTLAAAAGYLRG